jgi:putative transposase
VTRKQDSAKGKITAEDLKRLLAEDHDLLKTIVEETLRQVLEAEMEEALQASKGERTAGRLGYRAGYYNRMLVTRVGHMELRVPQDRQGRFRTEVFERYQRSEKALVAAMLEMYVQGVSTRKVRRSLKNCAGMSSALRPSAGSYRSWTKSCSSLPEGVWKSRIRI